MFLFYSIVECRLSCEDVKLFYYRIPFLECDEEVYRRQKTLKN